MNTHNRFSVWSAVLCLAFAAAAPAARAARKAVAVPEPPPPAAVEPEEPSAWSFGGDFRLRQEAFNHIPLKTGAESRGGENDYFRFRTRVWAAYAPCDWLTFNARLLHEFRHYLEPSHSHSWRWPDELVPDALNVQVRTADGTLKAVVGRQDFLPVGEYRLFGEGTAKDGSRSSYMDAVTLVARDDADRTRLTLFGAYDNAVDPLAIGDIDRDLNGYPPSDTGMDASARPPTTSGSTTPGPSSPTAPTVPTKTSTPSAAASKPRSPAPSAPRPKSPASGAPPATPTAAP